jgi:DNA-binding beta-propeller fold protein YncE
MRALAAGASAALIMGASLSAQPLGPDRPYKVQQVARTGGDGGFDYVHADSVNRRLYVPRSGANPRVEVFDLDTLKPVGVVAGVNGHGAAIDPQSGHGFATSKPVAMWDAKSLALIKTIPVDGSPDGILGDPAAQRIYILSHTAPNITAIDARDGSVVGAVDAGGAVEQTVSDGKGRLFADLENKDQVAVIDAKTMTVTARYGFHGECGNPTGIAIDPKNGILFVACRNPENMAVLSADTGAVLAVLPIGVGSDGAVFNPATNEAFVANRNQVLSVVKEVSPTKFVAEQPASTPLYSKTITLDRKTNRIFLITADFTPPPPDAAAEARALLPGAPIRRGPMIPGTFSIVEVGR